MSKTYGYSRVSTLEQETEKFQGEILRYSYNNDLGRVIFVEEKASGTKDWTKREIGKLINETCEEGDTILVPELSRISRNIIQIYEIISTCMDKGITLHFLKQNLVIKKDNDITTKVANAYTKYFQDAIGDYREMEKFKRNPPRPVPFSKKYKLQ